MNPVRENDEIFIAYNLLQVKKTPLKNNTAYV